eukprot:674061-Amphidinium_carterae.1
MIIPHLAATLSDIMVGGDIYKALVASSGGRAQEDKRAGIGVYTYPSGAIYSGQWDDDLQNGSGQVVSSS